MKTGYKKMTIESFGGLTLLGLTYSNLKIHHLNTYTKELASNFATLVIKLILIEVKLINNLN